jgi:hypothetical protein
VIAAVAIVVASSLAGCRDLRGEECRNIVNSVNSKLAEIDQVTRAQDPSRNVTSADMRQLASLYDALAAKTSAGQYSTRELAKLREDYHRMVLEAARLARVVADALDAKDLEAAMKAHEQFGEVVSKEDVLVSQVNSFCQNR